jgi:hypothetical protein
MLQEELKLNPIFRSPEEYDIYKLSEEAPKKVFKIKNKGKKIVDDKYGANMLE